MSICVQTSFSSFRYVFMPICTSPSVAAADVTVPGQETRVVTTRGRGRLLRCHWLLLVADMASQSVSVIDSAPNASVATRYISLFQYVHTLVRQLCWGLARRGFFGFFGGDLFKCCGAEVVGVDRLKMQDWKIANRRNYWVKNARPKNDRPKCRAGIRRTGNACLKDQGK